MMNPIFFIAKPLLLIHVAFWLGVRTVSLATLTWCQLLKAIVSFHVQLCWQIIVWLTASFTFPIRILTALERETKLERLLYEMQIQLEKLAWENKELEERLQLAIKDQKIFETVFEEIEEEHEKALARIDLLQNEVQELKEENKRLTEVQGKTIWNYKAHEKGGNVPDGISHWSTGLILRDSWGINEREKPHQQGLLKAACSLSFPRQVISGDLTVDEALERQRVVALYRSLFSSVLSILVAVIIWEAEDPCVPLVTSLFFVVGMSLSSVVQFFFSVKNKPASDAVALLSLNCFILGALTSPTLPRVAPSLARWLIQV